MTTASISPRVKMSSARSNIGFFTNRAADSRARGSGSAPAIRSTLVIFARTRRWAQYAIVPHPMTPTRSGALTSSGFSLGRVGHLMELVHLGPRFGFQIDALGVADHFPGSTHDRSEEDQRIGCHWRRLTGRQLAYPAKDPKRQNKGNQRRAEDIGNSLGRRPSMGTAASDDHAGQKDLAE